MQAKDTGTLINSLDIIAKDRTFVNRVLHGKASREDQIKKVRSLLNPAELERYDAGMRLITSLHKVKPPTPVGLDLGDVKNLPKSSADAVKSWLVYNADKVRLYGSLVDWLYTKDHRPNDIDIAIARPKAATEELAEIIKETSGKDARVQKYRNIPDSYMILVDGEVAVDTHPMSVYEQKMPYQWKAMQPAVMVDGIPTESLGEQLMKRGVQLLNPGIGIEGRGQIGPKAAQRTWREKDIPRMEAVARVLIREANKQGKLKLAAVANNDLRILMRSPVRPYPQVIPPEPRRVKAKIKRRRLVASRAGGVR